MHPASSSSSAFARYVADVERILDRRRSTPVKVREISALTEALVATADWLAPQHRQAIADRYARYLLHRDRANRFVVMSLVWLPGQSTPIHDHSCWGVMGLVTGELEEVLYERLDDASRPEYAELEETGRQRVSPGGVSSILPPYREIHRIASATADATVSVHVYGRDLDEINVFDLATRKVSPMRIRYYNTECGDEPFII